MKPHIIIFTLGALMIAYDLAGHACCAIARSNATAAALWNAHSRKVWPSIANSLTYDLFWTAWFAVALALMIAGYLLKR